MLPAFVLLAPAPLSGTTTTTVLADWLTRATGVTHAFAGELKDYPVFLSVRSGDPGRVKALVAVAYAGRWTQNGSTVRLMPTKPSPNEGLDEFTRGWKAATASRPNFADLPVGALYAMRPGEILRFGTPTGPYVRSLPPSLQKKTEASASPAMICIRRFANGCFETKIQTSGESRGADSGDAQIDFRSLPPSVVTTLGEEAKKSVLGPTDVAAIEKITANISAEKVDAKSIDRKDPLTRYVDPVLGPTAKALKEDVVVALPDFAVMGLLGDGKGTVESVFRAFSLFDDWTVADGAFVGRLPVSERSHRAQTRRVALIDFIRSTRDVGVPSSEAVATYLAGQRPEASESWGDAMLLVLSGVVLDQTHVGDYPFNLRLGAAMTQGDWARLKSGGTLRLQDLSPSARNALVTLLVQSRERVSSQSPDPVQWPGFPDLPLSLTAKVEDEDVVLGLQGGMTSVMTVHDAGFGYRSAKKALGEEPLYRPGRRRKLTLTIVAPNVEESIETGFADVNVAQGTVPSPYPTLPTELRKIFEAALKERDGMEPPSP